MWDRGHAFVGANGAGGCLHVDQARGDNRWSGAGGWWMWLKRGQVTYDIHMFMREYVFPLYLRVYKFIL